MTKGINGICGMQKMPELKSDTELNKIKTEKESTVPTKYCQI